MTHIFDTKTRGTMRHHRVSYTVFTIYNNACGTMPGQLFGVPNIHSLTEVGMAYSAMAVANAFVRQAKQGHLHDLTPMKLQKLMFYAQSWHLALKGKPLIDDHFSRWTHGPVVASIYHEFKEYGANPISDFGGHLVERDGCLIKMRPIVGDSDTGAWALIERIIKVYGSYSGPQLSAMTHLPNTAWSQGKPDGGAIANDILATHIRVELKEEAAKAQA